jgi:hypothetical protein
LIFLFASWGVAGGFGGLRFFFSYRLGTFVGHGSSCVRELG